MDLLDGKLANFLLFSWPLKSPVFNALIAQEKNIFIPVEQFKPITSIAAKKEKGILVDIQRIVLLDDPCEAVNSFPQIGLSCHDKNFFYFSKIKKHFTSTSWE